MRLTMARPKPETFDKQKIVAENRRARFDYFVEDRFEAGIELVGTEVKALRQGEGSIAESYATVDGDQVWLINSHIPEYSHGNRLNHEPRRQRKLLRLLPQMYSGRFARDPCVERTRAAEVSVDGPGLVGYGDGELITAAPLHLHCEAGAVGIFAPL